MSKIQKALRRLREDGQKEGDAQHTVASAPGEKRPNVTRNANGRDARGTAYGHRRYPLPDGADDEAPVEYALNVDIARLSDFGFQHSGADFDQLGQEFRRIKRPILNIIFGEIGAGARNSNVVMVAGALPESGKTFCSYNLSLSIARERDIGAVLVDADVLKPNISRAFGIEDRVGLIDYLLNPDTSLDDILVGTDFHDIVVVPAGQQHDEATELLASRRMEQFVHEMSERFRARAIVVDTPPLLLTNEAHVLAEHMGQIVFVVEAGSTSHRSITDSLEPLNRDKPINVILNKARGSLGGIYGDGYGGGYYGYYSAPSTRPDAD